MIQSLNLIVRSNGEEHFGIIPVLALTPLEYMDLMDGEKALIGKPSIIKLGL